MRKAFLVFCALLVCRTVIAHDLWIEKTGDGCILYYGHKHSQHDGTKFMQYSPDVVLNAECFDKDGRPGEVNMTRTHPVRIMGSCAVTYVLTSSGYWTKTPYGTKNVPKNEVQAPIKSWLSYEGVKRIDKWSNELSKPLTNDLELVALNDPLSLQKSDKLRLLVTYMGNPVEGVIVSYDGKPRGQTGKDGRINIRLRHDGFQIIQASYSVPIDSENADFVMHITNLNFEIGSKK